MRWAGYAGAMKTLADQLDNSFYQRFNSATPALLSAVQPAPLTNPRWGHRNLDLMAELGIDPAAPGLLELLAGSRAPSPLTPYAAVYSGHQFGHWAGQLGDGRALTLGELNGADGGCWELQLKGAGPTPYSRFADGRAVLRSSIREYLCSEAMHGLGIPTTRALSLVDSDSPVQRERVERGAVVCRLARSFIRFGHFEHFHYAGQAQTVATLADYLIEQHFPDWLALPAEQRHLQLFANTVTATATTIAAWQAVGFAHGVLNTDNMSLLGDTLDYGPFGFLDSYQPGFICNHSDSGGRYAFNKQPMIGLWNLNALANAFLSLLPSELLVEQLGSYQQQFEAAYRARMTAKLGLPAAADAQQLDAVLQPLLALLAEGGADYTRFFRRLALFGSDQEPALAAEVGEPWQQQAWQQWRSSYTAALTEQPADADQRQLSMLAVNPKYILRNYLAEQAIQAAEAGDYGQLERLFAVLKQPYAEQPEYDKLAALPPAWAAAISISCSS